MEETSSLINLATVVLVELKKIESAFLRRLPFVQLLEYIDSKEKLLALWPIVDRQFFRSNFHCMEQYNCQRWLLNYLHRNCILSEEKNEHVDTLYMEKLVREMLMEAEDVNWIITDLHEAVEDHPAFHDLWKGITHVELRAADPTNATISVKEELKSRFMTLDQLKL